MTGVVITSLPTASTLTGAEYVPVVQSGTTVKTPVNSWSYTPAGTGAVTTTVQSKLRETVSVKDFGAVGDGVTDDTAAIQAAVTAVELGIGTLWFPPVTGNFTDGVIPSLGYKITQPIVINKKISVLMDSPIIYDGPNTSPAITYGQANATTATKITEYHIVDIWVVNKNTAPWGVSTSVGAWLYAHKFCDIRIKNILGFDTGIVLNGDGGGFAYNTIYTWEIRGCRLGMKWLATNGGYVNENTFIKGRISAVPQPTGQNLTNRYGLETYTTGYAFENNTWINPCFELGSSTNTESIPIVLNTCNNNSFLNIRAETNKGWVARITGTSSNNLIVSDYGRNDPSEPLTNLNKDFLFVDDQTVYKQNLYKLTNDSFNSFSTIRLGAFSKDFYAYGSWGGFVGFGVISSSTSYPSIPAIDRYNTNISVDADGGIKITNASIRICTKIKLNGAQVIVIKQNTNAPSIPITGGYGVSMRCFDSTGALLYDPAIQYAKALNVNGSGGAASSVFGGCYTSSGAQHNTLVIGILSDVEYIDLLFGGDTSYVLYSVEISTPNMVEISHVPYYSNKVSTTKPSITTNVSEGTVVYNGNYTGTGAYAWGLLGGTWRDFT